MLVVGGASLEIPGEGSHLGLRLHWVEGHPYAGKNGRGLAHLAFDL